MDTFMTQMDYLNFIVHCFNWHIGNYENDFNAYCYNNHKCLENIRTFFDNLKTEGKGLLISEPYHKNGIGNNNEYKLYLKDIDTQGIVIERQIATLHITYGIYGGVSAWVVNSATGEEVCGLHYAR